MAAHFGSALKHRSAATDCLGIKAEQLARSRSIDGRKDTVQGGLEVG